jgi:hypothetical protein
MTDSPKNSETYRARAHRVRASAYAIGNALPEHRGLLNFGTIRKLVASGHAEALVESRRLHAEADALDDVACVLEGTL